MWSSSRACSVLATLVPCALSAGCSDPDLASELNTKGPPEVVEINVRSESAVLGPGDPSGLQAGESATFCRPGDQYLVNTVYCPLARDGSNAPIPGERALAAPVLDADPRSWYVRVIFDELLDPSIEELATDDSGNVSGHIAGSQPFVVTCGSQAIEYDGWLDPSGNHLSYPPGPGLVAIYTAFVATGSVCQIQINDNVLDKDGKGVPAEQTGPYDFAIAPLTVYSIAPADGSEGVALDATIEVELNAPIDVASVATRVVLRAGATEVPGTHIVDDAFVVLTPDAALEPTTTYTVTVESGITDVAGGPLELEEPLVATFVTGEAQ